MAKIGPNKYTDMQRRQYQQAASGNNKLEDVVGSFNAHNQWEDYEYLFKDIPNPKELVCLDFGCGPGRNLVKYANRFKRIDGVDLIEQNIVNAREYIQNNGLNPNDFTLYTNNGYDLENVPSDYYDIIISTICLQHICVHEIRYSLLSEFFRVLKKGGMISIQMGYGTPSWSVVDYYANHYDAHGTNRLCDTEIASPDQIEKDLLAIGFTNFKYYIRPFGPGDHHPNWIFFNAVKE